MIWTIIGAAIMAGALIGVAFVAHAYFEAGESGRRRDPDGYPILRDYHAERCPCDRCIWVMRGTIDRLERELGIGEYEGRESADESKGVIGATVKVGEMDLSRLTSESVTADRLFPPKMTDE